jgi:hypothetical protein
MNLYRNKFGIPENQLEKVFLRDKKCAYCKKKMIFPYDVNNRKNSATIEHLNFNGPFYWKDDLKIEDIVIVCGSCNSSRGVKPLPNWFKSVYCKERDINEKTVSNSVKNYLKRNAKKKILKESL